MLSYTRLPDLDFTRFVSAGYTSIDDWLKTVADYVKEGMTNRELYDLRQQTNLFTNSEIGMILAQSLTDRHLRSQKAKTAVLVDTAVKFGLSRVYEIQAGIHEGLSDFNVFYELDEAIEWLGQDVKRGFEMIDPSPSHDA